MNFSKFNSLFESKHKINKKEVKRVEKKPNPLIESLNKSKPLWERKWEIVIPGSYRKSALDAGEDEDYETFKQSLMDACNYVIDKSEDEDIIEAYEEYIEDIEYSDIEDEDDANYWLNELYDLLDNTNVFLGIDESLTEAIPRNFNGKSRDVSTKINNLGIDENPDAGNSEKEIEMSKTNPTIEKFLKALGLKKHPDVSNDFFFLTPIPAPSPFEKPLRRGKIRDIDPETGKCEIELSNLKWWCDYPTFRSIEIDSYKELFNFFKRNPVGNSSIMKIVDEYFNKYESLNEPLDESLGESVKLGGGMSLPYDVNYCIFVSSQDKEIHIVKITNKKEFNNAERMYGSFIEVHDNIKDAKEARNQFTGPAKSFKIINHINESLNESNVNNSILKDVIKVLSKHGFDTNDKWVKMYATEAASYIDNYYRDIYGRGYTAEDWYNETKMNYPDDLKGFKMLDGYSEDDEDSESNTLEKLSSLIGKTMVANKDIMYDTIDMWYKNNPILLKKLLKSGFKKKGEYLIIPKGFKLKIDDISIYHGSTYTFFLNANGVTFECDLDIENPEEDDVFRYLTIENSSLGESLTEAREIKKLYNNSMEQSDRDKLDPFIEFIDDIQNKDKENFCITWNFGRNQDGKMTGGIDFHALKKDFDMSDVLDEFASNIESTGFEFDDSIGYGTNPWRESNIFGKSYHTQVIEIDDGLSEGLKKTSLPKDIKKDIDDIYKTHGGEIPKWQIQGIAQDFPKYSKDIWRYVSELEESLNPLKESKGSSKIVGKSWQEFISNIEAQTGCNIDSSYKEKPEQWIELIDKKTGKIYDGEVTKYSDGSYELMSYNITPSYYQESLIDDFEFDDEDLDEAWDVNFYNELDADFGYDPGPGKHKTGLDKATAKSIARALDKRTPKFVSYWADKDDKTKVKFESLDYSDPLEDFKKYTANYYYDEPLEEPSINDYGKLSHEERIKLRDNYVVSVLKKEMEENPDYYKSSGNFMSRETELLKKENAKIRSLSKNESLEDYIYSHDSSGEYISGEMSDEEYDRYYNQYMDELEAEREENDFLDESLDYSDPMEDFEKYVAYYYYPGFDYSGLSDDEYYELEDTYNRERDSYNQSGEERPWANMSLTEDTIKQNGKWVNKGKEGTHGKFKTKKQADAQRKAMFSNGYKAESLDEEVPGGRYWEPGWEDANDSLDDTIDNYDDEELPFESLKEEYHWPNGMPVSDLDIEKALDFMYGEDRNMDRDAYSDKEIEKAINYFADRT